MGGMPSASDRRYSLKLGVSARNVFNKVNLANPSGILGSTFFDLPNALQGGPFSSGSANRRLDLQATFAFCFPVARDACAFLCPASECNLFHIVQPVSHRSPANPRHRLQTL